MSDLLHLTRDNEMPPGGFTYVVPETRTTVPVGRGPYTCMTDLVAAVRDHYVANSLVPPADLRARVEHGVCQRLPPGWCEDANAIPYTRNAALPIFDISAVKQFTFTMLTWWRDGFEQVSPEQVARRADTCRACPMHSDPDGCSSCNMDALRVMADVVIAGSRQPSDSSLRSCRVCGCYLPVKTRVPLAAIKKHMPAAQLDALPAHCWINTERV